MVFNEASVKFHQKLVREFYLIRKCNVIKNARVYLLVSPWTPSTAAFEKGLKSRRFNECGAAQGKSVGWSDRADDHFYAAVAIATGELSRLLSALIETLGGEVSMNQIPVPLAA